jgi:hypothetical protein
MDIFCALLHSATLLSRGLSHVKLLLHFFQNNWLSQPFPPPWWASNLSNCHLTPGSLQKWQESKRVRTETLSQGSLSHPCRLVAVTVDVPWHTIPRVQPWGLGILPSPQAQLELRSVWLQSHPPSPTHWISSLKIPCLSEFTSRLRGKEIGKVSCIWAQLASPLSKFDLVSQGPPCWYSMEELERVILSSSFLVML